MPFFCHKKTVISLSAKKNMTGFFTSKLNKALPDFSTRFIRVQSFLYFLSQLSKFPDLSKALILRRLLGWIKYPWSCLKISSQTYLQSWQKCLTASWRRKVSKAHGRRQLYTLFARMRVKAHHFHNTLASFVSSANLFRLSSTRRLITSNGTTSWTNVKRMAIKTTRVS